MRTARRTLAILLGALAAASGRAADSAPPPDRPAASDESIAKAKRDYDAMRSSRTTFDQKIDLGLSSPGFHSGNEEAPAFDRMEALRKKEAEDARLKQNNWLVDAMDPEKSGKNSRDRRDSRGTDSWETSGSSERAGRTDDRRRDSLDPRTAKAANRDNPLNNYMAGWMTSKDYDLLKVKAESSTLGLENETDRLSSSLEDSTLNRPRTGPATNASSPLVATNPNAPRPNPYLDADTLAGATGPGVGTRSAGSSLTPVAPVVKPTLLPKIDSSTAPSQSSRPAPFKPSDDSKYFKQLKRF
jgi:hypothetical protein